MYLATNTLNITNIKRLVKHLNIVIYLVSMYVLYIIIVHILTQWTILGKKMHHIGCTYHGSL